MRTPSATTTDFVCGNRQTGGRRSASPLLPIAIAVALCLALAAPAHASKGVVGYIGSDFSGFAGGWLSSPQGVAVNSAGVGGVPAGTIYVAEANNNRVSQFSPSGEFVRAWGMDVDTGGGAGFEVCEVAGSCKAGSGGSGLLGALSSPQGIAVNQANGDVYVTSQFQARINQFTAVGVPIRAFGRNVVASGPGNVTPASSKQSIDVPATVTGGTFSLEFGGESTADLAYDSSAEDVQTALAGLASIGSGNIAVAGGPGGIALYEVTFAGLLANNPEPLISVDSTNLTGGSASVAETAAGSSDFEICDSADTCQTGNNGGGGGAFGSGFSGHLAVAPVGAPNAADVLVADPGNRRVQEFDAAGGFVRAFGFDAVAAGPGEDGVGFEVCEAAAGDACKATIAGTAVGQFSSGAPTRVAVDSSGAVYTVEPGSFRVQKFTSQGGPPSLSPAVFGTAGAPTGTSFGDAPTDIAVGSPANEVFVVKPFSAGATPTCPDGLASAAERRIQELESDGVTLADTHMACNAIGSANGLAVDAATGTLYLSSTAGGQRVYFVGEPAAPPTVSIGAVSDRTETSARVSATINPNASTAFPNPPTTAYHFEYKLDSESEWTAHSENIALGAGTDPVQVNASLGGLLPNRDYDVRVVASKQFREGAVESTSTSFATLPAAPSIEGFYSSDVTASTALLNAVIDPIGQDTTYRFEYGETLAYGSVAPVPDGEIPGSTPAQKVSVPISGLNGGTYHFRVVAENETGSTTTGDQTFTFYPPACPNAHLRQQTGSASLPDCRAYELVSPENAGNALLQGRGPYSPVATGPSRFAFSGLFGVIPGAGPAAAELEDAYVATRGTAGWTTRYVGIPSNQAGRTGGLPGEGEGPQGMFSDLSMSRILNWYPGVYISDATSHGEFAPYVWSSDGEPLGRLPTDIEEVPGADEPWVDGGFYGDARPSPDLSHYAFSSANVDFTGDGLTSGSGSAYDNDIEAETVEKISLLPAGGDIPEEPGDETDYDFLRLPASSTDGSHILIEAPRSGVCGVAVCPPPPDICVATGQEFKPCPDGLPSHLYMRVDGAVTYDLSGDSAVRFKGMTPDGSRVYFTSADPVTPDDHDSSVDLFVWAEGETPEVSRLSVGDEGSGDGDGCAATWTAGCGVEFIQGVCKCGDGSKAAPARSDNSIAAEAGDVYFMSPEQLDRGLGNPDLKNLYVFRNGRTRYVATLDASATVNRIQVSPDGRHAAFVTAARLTAYDNTAPSGICSEQNTVTGEAATGPDCRQMYLYEPESETIRCVSCVPDGSRPESDVEASLNGLFMTDDGRPFFSTEDSLVPQDTNGLSDVYEFVDNRPQLISSGTASVDRTARSRAALISVSANGIDAYFSTFDTLVGQDKNGLFLKFYDARTNGGFPFVPPRAGCAAADECHGPSSAAPPGIATGTVERLGNGGNLGKKAKKVKRRKSRGKKTRRGGAKAHRQRGDRRRGNGKRTGRRKGTRNQRRGRWLARHGQRREEAR